ncbi:MAG: trypsin-like peptidase domain-containing protein [Bacteroidota bacterium]|nr:trypsin-like peptidase domain-containing protein [Bacteroidota bacterium]
MLKNKIPYALAFFSFLIFSGCALIFNGGVKPKHFYVASNVEGANVYNINGRKEYGTSPIRVTAKNASEPITILLEKENYAPVQRKVESVEVGGIFLFLDAMLICIPCIPDILTGAFNRFESDSVYIPMKRIREKDKEPLKVIVGEVQWGIREGEEIGKIEKEQLYFKKNNIDSRQYTEMICTELKETRLESEMCGEEKEGDRYNPKRFSSLKLHPYVRALSLKSIKNKDQYFIAGSLLVDWIFTTVNNDTVTIFPDNVSCVISTSEKRKSISALIELSLYKMLDDDKTFELISTTNKNKTFSEKPANSPIYIKQIDVPGTAKSLNANIRQLVKSVVTVEHKNGHGSGFIISNDGYILSNYHVIHGNKSINIRLNESITLKAEIVRSNPEFDLVLLKVNAEDLLPVKLGNSDSLEIGEEVIAIGTPEDISLGQSVSKGIVSGKRKIEGQVYIQTDVSVNSGNSGGPLINQRGEVVGIVSRKIIGKGVEGIAFGIPILVALEKLNIIINEK